MLRKFWKRSAFGYNNNLIRSSISLTSASAYLTFRNHMSQGSPRNSYSTSSSISIKLIAVNDVYEIDNWPNFATCKREAARDSNMAIGVLAGDFVAPSLLSSLDKGISMVDCMNASGIDYVCIGNHESDIKLSYLHERIRESKFTWINSNMPDFPLPADLKNSLPQYSIIQVESHDKSHKRRLCLLGLCGEDRSVMKPGAFNDCKIEPVQQKAKELYEYLKQHESVDVVIPMTHQWIGYDRSLAREKIGFPIIIGGHEHEVFNEEINGCKIIKCGEDCKNIAVIDLVWESQTASTKPPDSITITLKAAKEFKKDESVSELVDTHKQILNELETCRLCEIPVNFPLSSTAVRARPTTMGTFLCTVIRNELDCECCLIGAGSIRGNREYAGESNFTFSHLKSEFAFETVISIANLPGTVISDMISYTREFALRTPPVLKGAYLQTDDDIIWDATTNKVTHIQGNLIEPEKMYKCAMNHGMLDGLDNVIPLVQYQMSRPSNDTNVLNRTTESGFDAKATVVSYFSKLLLLNLLQQARGMRDFDTDGDGHISRAEFEAYIKSNDSLNTHYNNLLIDILFKTADLDHNGYICKDEIDELLNSSMKKIKWKKILALN